MPRTIGQATGFLLGFWLALWLMPLTVNVRPTSHAALERQLHRLVNVAREERSLIPLERRPELDAVARAHARDMVERRYFSHETPEGWTPPQRLQRAGITGFTLAAENLGITDRSEPSREILEAWRASEVHRQNLFAPPFNATGIGVARAPNGSLVYTQLYLTFPR